MDCTAGSYSSASPGPRTLASTGTSVGQKNRLSTSEVLDIIDLDEPVGTNSDDSLELDWDSL